jgi:hypothetical protein
MLAMNLSGGFMKSTVLLLLSFSLLADVAFARHIRLPGQSTVQYPEYGRKVLELPPVFCDENGRTYQKVRGVVYVDGLPATNGVTYNFLVATDGIVVYENWNVMACRYVNPLPPPPAPNQYNHYVKVCDPNCRWVTREIQ